MTEGPGKEGFDPRRRALVFGLLTLAAAAGLPFEGAGAREGASPEQEVPPANFAERIRGRITAAAKKIDAAYTKARFEEKGVDTTGAKIEEFILSLTPEDERFEFERMLTWSKKVTDGEVRSVRDRCAYSMPAYIGETPGPNRSEDVHGQLIAHAKELSQQIDNFKQEGTRLYFSYARAFKEYFEARNKSGLQEMTGSLQKALGQTAPADSIQEIPFSRVTDAAIALGEHTDKVAVWLREVFVPFENAVLSYAGGDNSDFGKRLRHDYFYGDKTQR